MKDQNGQAAKQLTTAPGSNIYLRPWELRDAPSLAQYANNPRIAASLRDDFPSPYTLNDANRFIAMATGRSSARSLPGSPAGSSCRSSSRLLLAIAVEGIAVGGIGIHLLDDVYRNTAEIGYWLGEPFWGKGIVTAAVSALVPVVFERFDIVRLQAGVFASNPASMRVLEKCGFVREAVLRDAITKNGIVMDEVMHVRFRDE
ncbi:GNAT family N-acetyltransferase [Methanogenium cariaci]|jgi:RimJ/RimL family protein N-acetyltransferase